MILRHSIYTRGFTKFGIKVLWRLQFLEYLRTLRLKQKTRTKIEVVLSLPCWLSQLNWDSQQITNLVKPLTYLLNLLTVQYAHNTDIFLYHLFIKINHITYWKNCISSIQSFASITFNFSKASAFLTKTNDILFASRCTTAWWNKDRPFAHLSTKKLQKIWIFVSSLM